MGAFAPVCAAARERLADRALAAVADTKGTVDKELQCGFRYCGDRADFLQRQLPGQYQLRVSATSKKLGKGGSVYADLAVPDFTKAPLVLSPIVLGYADGSHVPVGRRPANQPGLQGAGTTMGSSRPVSVTGAAGLGSSIAKGTATTEMPEAVADAPRLPFDPALDREFTRADALRTYFEVARAGKALSYHLYAAAPLAMPRTISATGTP